MRLTWGDREYDIHQVALEHGELKGTVNGNPVAVPVLPDGPHLVVGGSSPGLLAVVVTETSVEVQYRGCRWTLSRPLDDDAAVAEGGRDGSVTAPMPGKVLACEVSAGETVAVDQVLVRMESMKLQIEVRAPMAGRVQAVHVTEGQMVESGAVLVEFAPSDS